MQQKGTCAFEPRKQKRLLPLRGVNQVGVFSHVGVNYLKVKALPQSFREPIDTWPSWLRGGEGVTLHFKITFSV